MNVVETSKIRIVLKSQGVTYIMMRKSMYICVVLLLGSSIHANVVYAQLDSLLRTDTSHFIYHRSDQNNAFFMEAFGNSGLISLDLDLIYQTHFSLRIGAGFSPSAAGLLHSPLDPSVVTMINYLINFGTWRSHFFTGPFNLEAGLGMLTDLSPNYRGAILKNNTSRFKPTLFLGFRFQPVSENHIFRIGYTPFFDSHEIFHFAGVSYGYCIDPF